MLIKNATIVGKNNEKKVQDIKIKDGKIYRIADMILSAEDEVIDLEERLLIPGGIDVHVHLREPGYIEKETIETGTRAAVRGGYTTIMAMPNVIPFPDDVEVMRAYQRLIKKHAQVNVYPYACITKQEAGNKLVDMEGMKKLGVFTFSDDGVGIQNSEVMEAAMIQAAKLDCMIVAHTEDMRYRKPGACVHEGKRSKELNLIGIPSECEYKQVERDLELAEKTKVKYHICHMSAKESVEALRKAKAKGLNVSGEVTTHHLLLSEENVNNTNDKMNPPLREESDRQALLEGLLDGTIDFIANDHAPHTKEEKSRAMDKAPFGIVALETSIPLLYTNLVEKNIITLDQFQNLTSRKAAKRFGLNNKGRVKEGFDADLICLDKREHKIDKDIFESKGKNTPFDGYKVSVDVVMTIVGGKVIMNKLQGEN